MRDLLLDRLNIMDGTYGAVRASAVANTIAAEIDALTAERDAAREIAKKYEDRFFAAASQLAGARAEVERLRPAAEAWEAYRALWAAPFADPDKRDAAETRFQVAIAADSAARARAAKVTP